MFAAQSTVTPRRVTRPYAPHPRLTRVLWQCLALGALLVLAIPAARGYSLWFGPGPLWLLGAPVVSLLMLYRQAIAAVWRVSLVPAPRRRRPPMTFVLQEVHSRRDSVRLQFSGVCNATNLDPLPGGRPARQQRRSPSHDRRPLPVAGRRYR